MDTDEQRPAALTRIAEVAPQSFVFEKRDALDTRFCADTVARFEAAEDEQYPGRIGQGAWAGGEIKKSTDLVVSGKPSWRDVDSTLFRSLRDALFEFREAYPYFQGAFKDMGYAVQRTLPGEYYAWHIDGGSHEFSQRQLVAIWYLNDVPGPGGETEFCYQGLSIRPECGKLLLFPPFWTHRHRGVELQDGVKYIATTWIVFA